MIKLSPKKGTLPILQWMPPVMLAIDESYQRSIDNTTSRGLIQRIAKDWDWDLCQPLVIARRDDGSMYVVDGQHRHAAAMLRGDIEQLPCFVCSLSTVAAEADRFVQFNRNRKALKPLDLWKAAVASGDESALAIVSALEATGLQVHSTSNNIDAPPMTVTNIGGLQRCYREQGLEQLTAVADILASSYRGETLRYAGTIFTGIAAIVADECKATAATRFRESHRAGLLVECISRDGQAAWFVRVQRIMAESGKVRKLATEQVFREAWIAWTGNAVTAPVAKPAPTFDVARKPEPVVARSAPASLDPLARRIVEVHGMARPSEANPG